MKIIIALFGKFFLGFIIICSSIVMRALTYPIILSFTINNFRIDDGYLFLFTTDLISIALSSIPAFLVGLFYRKWIMVSLLLSIMLLIFGFYAKTEVGGFISIVLFLESIIHFIFYFLFAYLGYLVVQMRKYDQHIGGGKRGQQL